MKQVLVSVTAFIFAAFVMALLGYITESIELRCAILAGTLGLLGAGLALNSSLLALRLDNRMKEINTTLSQIEDLQKEIQKEQEEQTRSSSPIVMSLQALSQYYIDYLAKQGKQKTKDE
jgi:flagellar biosynthesis component FlhA